MKHRSFGFVLIALLSCFLLNPAAVSAQRREGGSGEDAADQKEKLIPIKQSAVLREFPDWVLSVTFSPDGEQLAAGSYEAVKVFDVKTRRALATLKAKSGYAKSLAYSPDGRLLAVGSYQSVRLWEMEKYQPVMELPGHRADVTGADFSPDGTLLATCSEDESIRLWNVADGSEVWEIREDDYPAQSVKFSPEGEWIAVALGDPYRTTQPGLVKVFHAATGKEKRWENTNEDGETEKIGLVRHEKPATDVAFSPDGRYLASTGLDKKVNVYDLVTGKALGYFDGHVRPTSSVVFLPGGKTIASCSRSERQAEIRIWNRDDGEELALIEKQQERVDQMALSPDGKTLATAGYDRTVMLWDLSAVLAKVPGSTGAPAEPVAAEKPTVVAAARAKTLRAGIIGLDTSHVIAFTRVLNDPDAAEDVANCQVVAAYPKGSPDIESSTSRVPRYTEQIQELGVEIVDSIPALIEKVDVVLLETNDGRPHLEQVLPVLKAGKPVFIDKPIAGTLADAVAIFEAAEKYDVPVFSSSSLRYGESTQEVRRGSIGEVLSCETSSPCALEKTHPDLFWYGIHGVEALFTVMGTGCQSVKRTVSTADMDEVVGTWEGGRTGTFRGYRNQKGGYGGVARGTKGTAEVGKSSGYRPLIAEIVNLFRTGEPPVSAEETLEIYAFMEAADESKRRGGAEVTLERVMETARAEAKKRLAELDR